METIKIAIEKIYVVILPIKFKELNFDKIFKVPLFSKEIAAV